MDPLRFLAAGGRHGVVTTASRTAAQIPRSTFEGFRARQGLDRPHHDVTLLPNPADPTRQRIAAAVAAVGANAAVTRWTAAYLRGLVRHAPSTVEVLVPHGASHRPHARVRVIETRTWDQVEVQEIDGIRVVDPARMLADLAGDATLDRLTAMAIDLRGEGDLEAGALDRELELRSRWWGRRRFGALASATREDGSDSGFELRTRARLVARGTPPDAGQLELVVAGRRRRIDLPYADSFVGIECIGFAYHGDRVAFDRDAHRRNDFVEDGQWRLLELTWTMFLRDWDGFVARLDRVLATAPRRA